jgi:alpha-L-rhamnosidase
MKRWLIGHLGQFVQDGIIDKDNYGDWCVPPEKPELIHSQDPARRTSKAVLATAYYIHNLDLLTQYAQMLGKNNEADDFIQKATAMRKAFNDKFLNRETGKYDNGTQTSCVLPLYFNIVPDDMREKVFAALVNNIENVTDRHIGTGLIGGQWLNRVLTAFGRADLSYVFTTNTTYPSWGYMVKQGATTVWELWNGDTADPAMNSGNHVMLVGDLIIWYYESLAGIKSDPEKPGFEHIIMKPQMIAGLNSVDAEINTVKGPVRSSWKVTGKRFQWNITIPVGSTATVYLPDGTQQENVVSGNHSFECGLP